MQSTLASITGWLVSPETVDEPVVLFDELARRLRDAGLVLARGSASLMTKHPDVYGKQLIWSREQGARAVLRSHAVIASAMYQDSPVAFVRRTRQVLRARLDGAADALAYELLRELAHAGMTDYVIFPMPFRSGLVSFVSWATDRPGGFRDEELALLEQIVPALSLRWELESATYALQTLLATYLGSNAATRVLDGEFKRRTGLRIDAVIWACDLRGFTVMVDQQPMADVLHTLDEYFSCVAVPVAAHGGEVLKFIGDAVLAVFPIGDDGPGDACARALRAADAATAALTSVNRDRLARDAEAIRFGLALHVGEVIYGNIGVEGRLDFTVIGRAVNEVSRVEALTKELGAPVLLTSSFVTASGTDRARSVGTHVIQGVSTTMELFRLTPLGVAASGA